MPLTLPPQASVLDALMATLDDALRSNSQIEAPPLALLWPDKNRDWEPVIDRVRERRPVLTLGRYDLDSLTGPAFWIRAALTSALPELTLQPGTPVIYLPGVGRSDIRAVEEAPRDLLPIVYLQYRGVVLTQPNGTKDLTPIAFLQNKEIGLGLTIAGSITDALRETLDVLLDQKVETLQALDGGLRADWLHALKNPDLNLSLLRWINDPESVKSGSAWVSFCEQVKASFGLEPERDGPVEAAKRLGEQLSDSWRAVWTRYREAPSLYPRLPERLRAAKPQQTLSLFQTGEVTWPQDNEAAEATLRQRLEGLKGLDESTARSKILELEKEHAPRRSSVWADLGQTPMAKSLGHLATLATGSAKPIEGGSFAQIVSDYRVRGWTVDAAAIDALAAVTSQSDRAPVGIAIRAVYTGWLRASAANFQAVFPVPVIEKQPAFAAGTCLLFADGLRYDLGKCLETRLTNEGCEVHLDSSICALPSVTPTAKPANSPVADLLTGGAEFGVRIIETGSALTQSGFTSLLTRQGFTVLEKHQTAYPGAEARGWTEFGEFDKLGHNYGEGLAQQIGPQLDALVERILALLEGGWDRVEVITDHGWLFLPGGMPKSMLPEHLTETRKGRCARLKPTSTTTVQTVPWRWDANVRIAVAPNITCFEEGKVYEHGGLSAQECIIPRLVVSRAGGASASAVIESVVWKGMRCTVKVSGASQDFSVDLRWKAGTKLAGGDKIAEPATLGAGKTEVRLVVEDSDHEGMPAFLVLLDRNDNPVAQVITTIGVDD